MKNTNNISIDSLCFITNLTKKECLKSFEDFKTSNNTFDFLKLSIDALRKQNSKNEFDYWGDVFTLANVLNVELEELQPLIDSGTIKTSSNGLFDIIFCCELFYSQKDKVNDEISELRQQVLELKQSINGSKIDVENKYIADFCTVFKFEVADAGTRFSMHLTRGKRFFSLGSRYDLNNKFKDKKNPFSNLIYTFLCEGLREFRELEKEVAKNYRNEFTGEFE
ncbi:MAG: hypothetical protein ACRCSY_07955 [Cetobacterium sp.]